MVYSNVISLGKEDGGTMGSAVIVFYGEVNMSNMKSFIWII